jgi:hypothetical protein
MAYDLARGELVLFGGWDLLATVTFGDTWVWDGATWTQRNPPSSPTARSGHAMTFDARRGRVVLYGGVNQLTSTRFSDTWEWDGSTWVQRSLATSPPALHAHAMTYDIALGRQVLFGGFGPTSSVSSDTWLLGAVIPSAVSRFGHACAGSRGYPGISAYGLPRLGSGSFALDLSSVAPHALCVFGLSAATQDLGLGPCALYLQAPLALLAAASNASGFVSHALPVPGDLSLLGAVLYSQGFVVDPLGAFAGLALTEGLKLTIGN